MRLGEVFFRVIATLCGWVILSTHMLLVLLVSRAVIEDESNLWLGTLVFGIVSIVAASLVGLGRPWRDVFRWITIPAALMLPFAIATTLPYLTGTTFGGLAADTVHAGLATGPEAGGAERAWAPVQLIVFGIAGIQLVRTWLPGAGQSTERTL